MIRAKSFWFALSAACSQQDCNKHSKPSTPASSVELPIYITANEKQRADWNCRLCLRRRWNSRSSFLPTSSSVPILNNINNCRWCIGWNCRSPIPTTILTSCEQQLPIASNLRRGSVWNPRFCILSNCEF